MDNDCLPLTFLVKQKISCFTTVQLKKLFIFIFFVTALSTQIFAQTSVGEWTMHVSYHTISSITGSDNNIFGAANAGILIYHKKENSVSTLNRKNGLNDVDISQIKYIPEIDRLIIGYQNGNMDLVKDNSINNFSGIKDNVYRENKTINDFLYFKDKVLIATGFGIIEFIPSTKNFRDIYYPEEGSFLTINKLTATDQYIYAVTDQGIFYADKSSSLVNPGNWERISTMPDYMGEFSHVEAFNEDIIVSYSTEGDNDIVYVLDENHNSYVLTDNSGKVHDIISTRDFVYIAYSEQIIKYSESFSIEETITDYSFGNTTPGDLFVGSGNTLWIGDKENSMVCETSKGQYERISRNSPLTDDVFMIKSDGANIFATAGKLDNQQEELDNAGMFYSFTEGEWNNYKFEEYNNFVDIAFDKSGSSDFYISSSGSGLLKFEDFQLSEVYNSENSPLTESDGETQVSSLVMDEDGNLLMVNHGATHPLVMKTVDNEWHVLEYDELAGKTVPRILWAKNGFVWGYFEDQPHLFVVDFNETFGDTDDDRVQVVTPRDHNENLYAEIITAIEEDNEGNIWFATDEGVAVVNDIYGIFDTEVFQPNRIRITEDNITQYLLRDNTVNDIFTDPGNRKWIATARSGIKLFSSDGKKMLSHYTKDNSPLLSDDIRTLAMNEKDGALFIGTSKGILSYRTDASEGKQDFSEAYVFPNPVRPGYEGTINITGLVEGVNVKITDINGNLVYETVAEGGQATWTGKTLNGTKVNTGVYLVFMTNEDGSKTHIEKILFIR